MRRAAAAAAVLVLAGAAMAAQAPQALETFDAAWTIVRDTHFDRTFNGVNWDSVRTEFRPRAAAARSTSELRGVLRDMLGRLGQSHFAVLPAQPDPGSGLPSGTADPGLDVRLTSEGLLVASVEPEGPAAEAGVRAGWRVLAIGGMPVETMLQRIPEGTEERFRRVEAWRAAQVQFRGPAASRVPVLFEDENGRRVERSLDRRPPAGQPVTVGNLPTMFVRVNARRHATSGGRQAGVIAFNVWMAAVDAEFQKAIDDMRSADGIVIDLRGNPGGLAFMLSGISGHFLGDRVPLGVMKTRDTEVNFVANPRLVDARGARVAPYSGPVAILVDSLSGSASECFTGGMQAIRRARVFGETTMGQALPALFDRLPNGDVLIHAFGDFVTADGMRLEGRGVVPDEAVPLRRADLLAGRDRALEAALAWIDRSPRAAGASNP